MNQCYLVLDLETYSQVDLVKAGQHEYALDHSTEILCAAWKLETKGHLKNAPIKYWLPDKGGYDFADFLEALRDPDVILVAHNSSFEAAIIKYVFARRYMPSKPELKNIPIERWVCTQSLCRAMALPPKLEDAARELNLPHQKDMEGHRLMMKMSKPRKPTKHDPSTRHLRYSDLLRLTEYCGRDVEAETDLFLTLPELTPKERKLWCLNQKINERGFLVDRELVTKCLKFITKEKKVLNKKIASVSNGALYSAGQVAEVLKFLKENGTTLPNLQAKTVGDALAKNEFKKPIAKEILEIRYAISRSSTSKYQAFELRSRHDGRARDNTLYFGGHTGREAGNGLQPHNLFKTIFPQGEVEAGIKLIKAEDIHTIRALFPRPLELYASCLRSSIIAPEGNTLDVGDWATIELRVLFWLAGHTKGLEALESGEDLYVEMASVIYRLTKETLLKRYREGNQTAKTQRHLGKGIVLGAGFGCGPPKFVLTSKQQGIEVSLSLAKTSIYAYRKVHYPIPIFWENINKAALMAMGSPGKKFRLRHIVWEKKGDFLLCHLPSGHPIAYFKPKVEKQKTPWGMKPVLTYWARDTYTKKFIKHKTWGGKLAENVTQAVARDVLMEALLRLDATPTYSPVLTVHDEIVSEREKQKGSFKEFIDILEVVPDWAKGLPIKVEGFSEERYRK